MASLRTISSRIGRRTGVTVTRYPMPGTLPHHLRVLFGRLDVGLLVDVGGHAGEYGTTARTAGYAGPIVSYDPSPAPDLLQRANGDGRWLVRRVACSDVAGPTTLHQYGASHPFNSLQAAAPMMGERFDIGSPREVAVERVRLDHEELLATAENMFLKVDAQGHDLHVLEGATGVLDRVRLIQMELAVLPIYEGAARIDVVVDRLRSLGFDPTGFFPVTRATDGLRVIEFDGVFLRGDAVEESTRD